MRSILLLASLTTLLLALGGCPEPTEPTHDARVSLDAYTPSDAASAADDAASAADDAASLPDDAASAADDAASLPDDAASAADDASSGPRPGECGRGPCPPECFRAVSCVTVCGGPVTECGCCGCAEGSIDTIACGDGH